MKIIHFKILLDIRSSNLKNHVDILKLVGKK